MNKDEQSLNSTRIINMKASISAEASVESRSESSTSSRRARNQSLKKLLYAVKENTELDIQPKIPPNLIDFAELKNRLN